MDLSTYPEWINRLILQNHSPDAYPDLLFAATKHMRDPHARAWLQLAYADSLIEKTRHAHRKKQHPCYQDCSVDINHALARYEQLFAHPLLLIKQQAQIHAVLATLELGTSPACDHHFGITAHELENAKRLLIVLLKESSINNVLKIPLKKYCQTHWVDLPFRAVHSFHR